MTEFVTNFEWNKITVAIFVVITVAYFIRYSVDLTKGKEVRGMVFFDLGMMLIMGATAFRFANPRAMHVASGIGTQMTVDILLLIGVALIAIGIFGAIMRRRRSRREAA